MTTLPRTPKTRLGRPRVIALALGAFALSACADSLTDPLPAPGDSGVQPPADTTTPPPPPPPTTGAGEGEGSYTAGQLKATGKVVDTPNGYTVDGALEMALPAGNSVTFEKANLNVAVNAAGKVTNISGTAVIPSPHERIEFADPVEADIGLFSGRYLNQTREFDILLKDDTDYFVFHIKTAFEMRVATGETGANAVKPIKIAAPIGYEILMIMDYTDPMYFVYGSHDLIGDAGIGWSLHGRIPFVPTHPVAEVGSRINFDGKNIRTGTFPLYGAVSVHGVLVDNQVNEAHLSAEDPFASSLTVGYQAGINGEMSLGLGLKLSKKPNSPLNEIFGFEIPLASASAGVLAEAGTRSGLVGHAYIHGETAGYSWWPTFIPFTPAAAMVAEGVISSDGDFRIELAGQMGIDVVGEFYGMTAQVQMLPDALTIRGAVEAGRTTPLAITGTVTAETTTIALNPPVEIYDAMFDAVQAEVGAAIADAQKAYDDVVQATKDYEFEWSLRGFRQAIPPAMDQAKVTIDQVITSRLNAHKGTVYYSSLSSALRSFQSGLNRQLDALKAQALQIQDNDATRRLLEQYLRTIANLRNVSYTYRYKVLGVTIKTVTVNVTTMSATAQQALLTAADNVKNIKATSDIKIKAETIYNQIPSKALFESLKDQIVDGVIPVPRLTEIGLIMGNLTPTYEVYAVLDGSWTSLGKINLFDIPALAADLARKAVEAVLSV
ncbi:MAG: hypothetical protein R3E10_17955 [Gemmatimonadota bacterium]